MSRDGANYVASLLSGVTPEEIALRMAQAFINDQLHAKVETSQLAVIREDGGAFFIGPANVEASNAIKAIQVRVTKDGSTVERA